MPVYESEASSYRRNANTAWFMCSRVEDSEANEQVEVLDRQAGDRLEEIGLQLCDHVLEGVLAEVGQVHERAGCGWRT